jgi:prevent-host-death family protein
MKAVKISELKAKLSAYVKYVQGGEEVVVLDRKSPVARLTSINLSQGGDAHLDRLIAQGIVTPPKNPPVKGRSWPRPPGPTKITREVMKQVWREERNSR